MKLFLLLCMVSLVYTYDDIDPSFDYIKMVNDPEEEKKFMACFIDLGPCTEVTSKIKAHLRESVEDGCRECKDWERHYYRIFLLSYKKRFPELFKRFTDKFDLDGKHFALLEKELEKY